MSEQISITIPNTPECIHALHSFASVLITTAKIPVADTVTPDNTYVGETPIEAQEPKSNPESSTELDSDGIPWDARIHSSGKTKIKDGTWKKLRGLPPGFANSIIKEIKKRTAASTDTLTVAPITVTSQEQVKSPAPVQLQQQQVTSTPSQGMQFKDLMAAMANKGIKFNGAEMVTALLQHGVVDDQGGPCFSKLVSMPEKILDVAITAGLI